MVGKFFSFCMNVSELARQLHVNTKQLLEILPGYGFDIGAKAIKIDDRTAQQVMRKWKFIKRELEEKRLAELEEQKKKERELRKESGVGIVLPQLITVREFAEKMNMPVTQLIGELMKNGILANQNQNIDYDTAGIIAEDLGFSVQRQAGNIGENIKEQKKTEALEEALGKGDALEQRPPVVVVMGHVDHGKTKLLDTIRQAHIIDTESGGITQHIGAYQTIWKDPKTGEERQLSFIDTPGHEAFTVMRSRGAKVADIGILVVAADDGVKPQTEEVIQILKAAKLPFVVAINKIDKETADVQRVKTELSQHNIIPEEWGGNVPMVEISAKANTNIDKLLDVLLLVSDMHAEDIQADSTIPAIGTIIESHVDKGMGPVATVLVQAGTLRKGDPLVVNGEIYGKIRAMKNYLGASLEIATPSTPVQIIGFKVAPEVGDVMDLSKESQAQKIDIKQKKSLQTGAEKQTILDAKSDDDEEKGKNTLNVLIKTDVLGSLEAIVGSLQKIRHDEVGVKIIGKGLGNITEDDVHKAQAGEGTIVGFKVKATPVAEESMRENDIRFLQYDVIYDLINWVKDELEKLLDVEKIVTELGVLKVLAVFRTDKKAMTVGGRVESGKILEGSLARVKRKGEYVGQGKIVECQIGKQKMKEVAGGTECGIRFEGKTKIETNDVIESYSEESKVRKIEFLK
ncbi:MAG: translation initiation factor IF-2 [Candidatus Magasanikbacteria bacterium RIFCSPLOWO2_12_FULL_47_9b]|nr:MAG: translation initiation factor IF-2 [Candidatus Magasanikbacteria bacterium RIFCSPLOWO2_02_FULL_47_16]OGH83499.1 MAG: translation initiation factor IF-2 [Candidatus Magasanikbacteria bacterium RIFCSPLOWO2_12_FULL_47_9b]